MSIVASRNQFGVNQRSGKKLCAGGKQRLCAQTRTGFRFSQDWNRFYSFENEKAASGNSELT
jgi:hypothetical protein